MQRKCTSQIFFCLTKENLFILLSGEYCPGTFDGWLCWPDIKAGTFASAPCPDFVIGFDPKSKSFQSLF